MRSNKGQYVDESIVLRGNNGFDKLCAHRRPVMLVNTLLPILFLENCELYYRKKRLFTFAAHFFCLSAA
jgi:hypothetical protein